MELNLLELVEEQRKGILESENVCNLLFNSLCRIFHSIVQFIIEDKIFGVLGHWWKKMDGRRRWKEDKGNKLTYNLTIFGH